MLRPFLSLLIAVVGSVSGLSLSWLGGSASAQAAARMQPDVSAIALMLLGVVLVAVAALSLAIHWVGALVVGAIHALLGLLALVVPLGNPFDGGIFSPVFQITRMLSSVNRSLGDGAAVFYFSGTAFVLGAFLVGAALGVRSRRLAARSSLTAVAVSSVLGGVLLVAATAIVLVAGGQFVRGMLQMFRYDAALGAITVFGGVLAGVVGILLRWSSIGVLIVGTVVLVGGLVLFASPAVALSFPGYFPAMYGLVMVLGVTFLAAAAGGMVRGRDEVPVHADAL